MKRNHQYLLIIGGALIVVAVLLASWRGRSPSKDGEAHQGTGKEREPPDSGQEAGVPSDESTGVTPDDERPTGAGDEGEEPRPRVPQGVIRGHVVDRAGAPVVEAEVAVLLTQFLEPAGERETSRRRIGKDIFEKLLETDAEGWFEVTSVPHIETVPSAEAADTPEAAMCILVVQKEGYRMESMDVRPGQYELRIVLDETVSLVSGRVVVRDTGEPVEGARIVCRSAQAISDAEGRFDIKAPVEVEPPEELTVSVLCFPKEPYYAPQEKRDVRVVQGGRIEGVLFELDGGSAVVEGRIVNQHDELVPGMLVRLYEYDRARYYYFPDETRPDVVADAPNGTFAFTGLRPGTYQLEAVKSDWQCVLGRQQVTVEATTEPHQVKILANVSDGRVITGTVSGPEGEPVEHAAIWLLTGNRIVFHQPAPSDAEGRYGVQAPPRTMARSLKVMAFHPAYELSIVPVRSDTEELIRVDLTLKKAGQLAGTVVDDEGEPAEAVTITVEGAALGPTLPAAYSYLPNPGAAVMTGSDGTFTFAHLAPGTYLVTAEHERYVVAEQSVEIVSGVDESCDFTLDGGLTIEGVVVDEAGKPLSVRSVVAVDGRGREHDATESGVDGRFVLRTLPRDRQLDVLVLTDQVNLRRDKSFYYAKVQGVQPGRQDVRVVAKRMELGVVELEVVDSTTDEPVARYEVWCSAQPRPGLDGLARSYLGTPAYGRASVRDEGGRARLDDLLPGSHRFTVSADGYAARTSRAVQVPSGGTATLRVELVPRPATGD